MEKSPSHIHLNCDSSCNLHCSTCRNHVTINSDDENKKLVSMLENFVRPALKDCTTLSCLGSGEFFASKPIFDFFRSLDKKELPFLKVNIMTNGTLFTPERFDKLSNLNGMVNRIHVSIDAANKLTYEKLRRGGKWETLCENMEYISSLRVSNEIKNFTMSFVVQKENFRQMRDYVTLAKQWHADEVTFRRLKFNSGAYSTETYMENDVFSRENQHYDEAVKILTELKRESEIRITDNCITLTLDQLDES